MADFDDELTKLSNDSQYRGGFITAAKIPLRIIYGKKIILDDSPLRKGVGKYFSDYLKENKGSGTVTPQSANILFGITRLDEMIDLQMRDETLEKLGIAGLLPEKGVGFLRVGVMREDYEGNKTRFFTVKEFGKDFIEAGLEFLTNRLQGDYQDIFNKVVSSHLKSATKENLEKQGKTILQVLEEKFRDFKDQEISKEDPKYIKFMTDYMALHYAFLHEQMKAKAPTAESIGSQENKIHNNKLLDVACLQDGTVSRHEGFFYVLERDGVKTLYYAPHPKSPNRAEVTIINGNKDKIIQSLEAEKQYDAEDPLVENPIEGDIAKHVTQEGKDVNIDVRRSTQSPINHVPLMTLLDEKFAAANIGVGEVNPVRENVLYIKKGEKK